eukprot:7362565-Pyramimonas_sp.AAC.2
MIRSFRWVPSIYAAIWTYSSSSLDHECNSIDATSVVAPSGLAPRLFLMPLDLPLQAFNVLLSKPEYITVKDVLRLRCLNYVWGRQVSHIYDHEVNSVLEPPGLQQVNYQEAADSPLFASHSLTNWLKLRNIRGLVQAFDALFIEKKRKGFRLSVDDVVMLNEADSKWGRKAQRLSIGRWIA